MSCVNTYWWASVGEHDATSSNKERWQKRVPSKIWETQVKFEGWI